MSSKSSDLSETYLSSDRAEAWQRESQRRKESSGAAPGEALIAVGTK